MYIVKSQELGQRRGTIYLETGPGEGAGNEIVSAYFDPNSTAPEDYEGGGTITITAATLISLGFTFGLSENDLTLNLPTQILDPVPN